MKDTSYLRGYQKGYSEKRSSVGGNSETRKAYLDANELIMNIRDEREKFLNDAGNAVAKYIESINNSGTTNTKAISAEIAKLTEGFSKEEACVILTIALTKVAVNL